jgi:hypothetical protein
MRFMKKIIHFLFITCVAGIIATATAQNAQLPAFKVPLLQRAPVLASWTLKFNSAHQQRSADPDPIQSITVTKSGKTYREQIVHASGQTEEKWVLENVQLQTIKSGITLIIDAPLKGKTTLDCNNYGFGDFGGLEWVSPSHFRGSQLYQGKTAYLFEMPKGQGKVTAILSADTQLPLSYSDDQVVCTYSYNTPPQELTPPEKVLATLKSHRAGLERLKFHPSEP